jgi:HK97 family phage prohead protease
MPGSFKKTIKENFKRIKHLYNHDRTMLVGAPLEMKEDAFGLLVRSAMNIEKQFVADIYSDYKFFADHKRTLEHSIGYNLIKWDFDKTTDTQKNKEYQLFEYSTLSFLGCNELTPMVDLKNIDDAEESIKTLEAMLKGQYSEERYAAIESTLELLRKQLNNNTALEEEAVPDTSKDKSQEQADADNLRAKQLKHFLNLIHK